MIEDCTNFKLLILFFVLLSMELFAVYWIETLDRQFLVNFLRWTHNLNGQLRSLLCSLSQLVLVFVSFVWLSSRTIGDSFTTRVEYERLWNGMRRCGPLNDDKVSVKVEAVEIILMYDSFTDSSLRHQHILDRIDDVHRVEIDWPWNCLDFNLRSIFASSLT